MKPVSIFAFLCLITSISQAAPPSAAEVKRAYRAGAESLRKSYGETKEDYKSLVGLAMYKGGVSPNTPEMRDVVEHILEKFEGDEYKPGSEHLYEAGVEATLLADLNPEKYRPQLKALVDYILEHQMTNGGWDYPNGGHGSESLGDTSVIQYVMLGLWAARRAGIDVPDKVWEDTLKWHAKTQNTDGGFGYCPGTTNGDGAGASTLNMTVNAIGSIHIAMLQLDPEFLPLSKKKQTKNKKDEKKKEPPKFGVLEAVTLDEKKPSVESASIPPASVQAVRRAFGYLGARFMVVNQASGGKTYYYYSMERMAALANIDQIGSHVWFDECAEYIISIQEPDGGWGKLSRWWASDADTAFCVLFLTRSTGKLLKRVNTPKFGDGLLAGGRGLPDDLTDVDFNGRSVKMKEKPTEPLDILLASLSKTGGLANLDEVQNQIVEQVQLGNREDLVGQIDQLLKLVDHPDPGIRQTVIWALGRTGNMNLAQHLIDKLSDDDLNVMIEARTALCWISRKPLGFGFPDDPLIDLSANASQEQKDAAIAQWHKNLVLRWGEWYLKNRPFEDRGDAFEAELTRKMNKLKYGF